MALARAGGAVKYLLMLPKSRIFSALVFGLGVALLVAGLVMPRFISVDARLPLDLAATTWTLRDESGKARVTSAKGSDDYEGPLTIQTHMDIRPPADMDTAAVRIGRTVMRGEDPAKGENLLSAGVWSFTLDRVTGEALDEAKLSHTPATPVDNVAVDGYWLKFPMDAEKTNYPVFDVTLRKASEAVFQEELQWEGRTVYRYRQEIAPTNVAKLYPALGNTALIGEGEDAKEAFLYHSAQRDLFVDQQTGLLVDADVTIDDYYGDDKGERKATALKFEGSMREEDTAAFLAAAEDFPEAELANTVRWVMVASGALLAAIGLAGTFGVFARLAKRR